MQLNEYQKLARKTAIYPSVGNNVTYVLLGLAGEDGELCNKAKKVYRHNGGLYGIEQTANLGNELSDVLWYLSSVASELGIELNDLAEHNLIKLGSRKERGVLGGSGDSR